MRRFPRLLRSLHVQFFLWAVLPVAFFVVALASTSSYAYQRRMEEFVVERDLSLVRMTARLVEDGIARGVIDSRGQGLSTWMSQSLSSQPEAITVIVVDGQGTVLAHPDPGRIGSELSAAPIKPAALRGRAGSLVVPDESGDPLLVTFARVEGAGWSVIAWEPLRRLIGPVLRLSGLTPFVAAGAAVLSMLIIRFGWRTIVRPLQQLAQAAEQVSWGDFSAISQPVGGVQEIHDLHQALADMTDRIQYYEAGVRDYLAAITQGQEAERARLARVLHDGPVQDLIALGQRAEMAQRLVERGEAEEAEALLEELRGAELAAVEELRRLIRALRPSYLEDLGFVPALDMLVRQVAMRTAARVELHNACPDQRLAPDVELAAYRIAQEALNNALQHAQADNITLSVRCDSGGLELSVVDDGVGFELPPRPDVLTQAGHFGLLGMRERATLLGGSFAIGAAAGGGTRVTVRLPACPPAS
jgi:signal transduction histidine kinase